MPFIGDPYTPLSPDPDGRSWETTQPLAYRIEDPVIPFAEQVVRVPAGFRTDFASVPRALWSVVPPWGRYGPAAIVHDWLYATHETSRPLADSVFLEAMTSLRVAWWRRWAMWGAVRLFGRRAFKTGPKRHGKQMERLCRTGLRSGSSLQG